MSFWDDVDGLTKRLGFAPRKTVLIGVALSVCAFLLICLALLSSAFLTPGIVVEPAPSSESVDQPSEAAESSLYVHVTGSVAHPGMYKLDGSARVQDAIEAAGGFSDDALDTSVNLARPLTDGEQIVVASRTVIDGDPEGTTGQTAPSGAASSGKININTANLEQLTTLKGIGDATAEKIIAYRETNGSFKTTESLKEVSGIGEKKFEAIKDQITV